MDTDIIDGLRAIVGDRRVITDSADAAPYGLDRTSFWQSRPGAVVLPGNCEEVAAVIRLANRHRLAVVPSGGRTGLSGGAMATSGELVLALDRMNRILELDPGAATLTCEAGTITQAIQQAAAEQDLFYPVDFASSGSSQIGGNIATNAGGIRVIRYGGTRHWVLGLKVVTGSGEILDLNRGLVKNNSGYDFRQLFIGSEGTLGIVCEVTLALARPPRDQQVMLLGVPDFHALAQVLALLRRTLTLSAFEFFCQRGLAQVQAHTGARQPLSRIAPFYALVEFDAGSDAGEGNAMAAFQHCIDNGWATDGVLAQNQSQARALWRLREDMSESLAPLQPWKNDLAVTVARVPDFIDAMEKLMVERHPDLTVVWFGHLGDGNIHLNVLKPDRLSSADFARRCQGLGEEVARQVAALGGSISAEHGIGLLKKQQLRHTNSDAEIALMKQVKAVFDPNGIMNPGKLFDTPSRQGDNHG